MTSRLGRDGEWEDGRDGIDKLLRGGSLELVEPDRVLAESILEAARTDLAAAMAIVGSFPSPAFDVAYDAARKAVVALMECQGLRVRAAAGGHRVVGQVVAAQFGVATGRRFQALRRLRNSTEYPTADAPTAGASDAEAAVAFAAELIDAVAAALNVAGPHPR